MLTSEIEANFEAFNASWQKDLPISISTLKAQKDVFLKSYSRIASVNAWKNNVLRGKISDGSLAFFAEALNDALVSHVFAHLGTWRSALMALRSCIENTYNCLYYKDHPIELRLWEEGKHKPGFSEMHSYLEHHPDVISIADKAVTGLELIKKEYAVLSRAVHASAVDFRMSPDINSVSLWKPDIPSLNKWSARERAVLGPLNMLLTSIFRQDLQGTSQPGLRKVLNLAISSTHYFKIKTNLGVVIPAVI